MHGKISTSRIVYSPISHEYMLMFGTHSNGDSVCGDLEESERKGSNFIPCQETTDIVQPKAVNSPSQHGISAVCMLNTVPAVSFGRFHIPNL